MEEFMHECPYFYDKRNLDNYDQKIDYEKRSFDIMPRYDQSIAPAPKKNFNTEEALSIAKYLNVNLDKYDVEQFRIGLNVELEHGRVNEFTDITNDDPILTGKITLAHLNEFPDYYKRLTNMEEDAEKYWERKNKKINEIKNK
jgi:hypothetical protein